MNIKNTFAVFTTALCIATASASALAATGEQTGKIGYLVSHDSTIGADSDFLGIIGTRPAGNPCPTYSGGYVVYRFRDDARGQRQMAIALAALTAGKTVTIGWDDTKKGVGGNCLINYIVLNPT